MKTGLENMRERMADYLREQGVEAVTAWSGQARQKQTKPVVVVSLRECQAGPAGFQDYLGEQYDEASGLWLERYGRKATLTFGLDLYAPAESSEAEVQKEFDTLAGALAQGGPDGLAIEEFSCGEMEYDQSGRLLKQSAQAVCQAYLCAVAQESDTFVDFELRGGLQK
jgi:hypothetical protein